MGIGLGEDSQNISVVATGTTKEQFLPAAKHAGQWIMIHLLLLRWIFEMQAVRGQIDKATCVIEVTDTKYEVRLDLRGCLEAVVTSEAAKRVHTI